MADQQFGEPTHTWISALRLYGLSGVIGAIGLGILMYGLWVAVKPDEPVVEIVSSVQPTANSEQKAQIFVDVAGAVEKPGVYYLDSRSRVGEALVAAGGLSAVADREWVSKNLNLAQELKDGGKIYIPDNSDNQETQSIGKSVKSENQKSALMNINTASQSELETLSGIGVVRAQAIIANRPYSETRELVAKAKIPQSVYDTFKDAISVY